MSTTPIDKAFDTVIVGGGPVGLTTALTLAAQGKRVVVLEKHDVYQRRHVVQLSASSFKEAPDFPVFRTLRAHKSIRTSKLEEMLQTAALAVGVEIRHAEATRPAALARTFPKANLFIGTDGSHSVVHRTMFAGQRQFNDTLRYIAEVKYTSQSAAGGKLTIGHAIAAIATGASCIETVGKKEADGTRAVTLRFFINKKTYDRLRAGERGTFRTPHLMDDVLVQADPLFAGRVARWMKTRELLKAERLTSAPSITTTQLDAYAASTFHQTLRSGRTWAVVGDAAIGMPYFRSLNNGLISAFSLGKAVRNHSFAHWEAGMQKLAKHERMIAKVKTFFLSIYIWLISNTFGRLARPTLTVATIPPAVGGQAAPLTTAQQSLAASC